MFERSWAVLLLTYTVLHDVCGGTRSIKSILYQSGVMSNALRPRCQTFSLFSNYGSFFCFCVVSALRATFLPAIVVGFFHFFFLIHTDLCPCTRTSRC